MTPSTSPATQTADASPVTQVGNETITLDVSGATHPVTAKPSEAERSSKHRHRRKWLSGKRLTRRVVLPIVALACVAGLGYKIYPSASPSPQASAAATKSFAAPAPSEAISPAQRLARRIAHRARAATHRPPEALTSTYELAVGSIACQDCKVTAP
jgi:hypothetical protein